MLVIDEGARFVLAAFTGDIIFIFFADRVGGVSNVLDDRFGCLGVLLLILL